jgi:hypothetical protein
MTDKELDGQPGPIMKTATVTYYSTPLNDDFSSVAVVIRDGMDVIGGRFYQADEMAKFRQEETVLYDRFEVTKCEMFFVQIDGRETMNYAPPTRRN